MPITSDDYADMAISTLANLGEGKFQDNISKYQSTVALKKIMKSEKVMIQGGDKININRAVDHNHSAEHVGLAYTVTPSIRSILNKGEVPWRHTRWDYAWEYTLLAMNSGANQIIDFMQTQRVGGMASAIIKFEQTLWRAPLAADTTTPYGIPYWLVRSATAFTSGDGGNYGFNGLVPQDHTLVGNINPSTEEQWRNYAEPYTAITQDDVVRKLRRAIHYTSFEKLVTEIGQQAKDSDDVSIYTNWAVVDPLEVLLKGQNDNLGMDLDPTGGKAVIRRIKVEAVRELDDDSTNAIWGVNWATFDIVGLRNRWMAEDRFAKKQDQPTVGYANTHCTWNTVCYDRRRNFVLSNGTTEMS